MFEKIEQLITALGSYFDSVALNDDNLLKRSNTAILFIDRIIPEPITFGKVRYTGEFGIIFSVAGTEMQPYKDSDTKINNIQTELDTLFSYYEFMGFEYNYQIQLRRLYVYVEIKAQWEV